VSRRQADDQITMQLRQGAAQPVESHDQRVALVEPFVIFSLIVTVPDFHWRAATVHKPDQCPPAPVF
jgi:hypothetical protein